MTMELLGFATGNTRRAAIALEEAGLAYQGRTVDLGRAEHHEDWYRAINPAARVPALIDPDGPGGGRVVVTQSNAIMLYVAEKSGRLLPASGAERIAALEWLFFFITDVIAPSNQSSFLSRAPGGEGAAARWLEERALAGYEHVERRLAEHRYLAGDTFSLADIAGYTVTEYLAAQRPPTTPGITRWLADVGARPAVVRGMSVFRN